MKIIVSVAAMLLSVCAMATESRVEFNSIEQTEFEPLFHKSFLYAVCPADTQDFFEEQVQMKQSLPVKKARSKKVISQAQGLEQLTASNYNDIIFSSECVIVDVYTDWCGPCKYLAPIYSELNDEYGHLYKFVKLNGETEDALMRKFNIRAFPTLIFIKNGKEVGRQAGFRGKEHFISEMNRLLQ